MNEDQRASIQFQRTFGDLTRVDRDMVNSAFSLFFISNDDILTIKIENAELFGFPVGHGGVAIIQQGIPA